MALKKWAMGTILRLNGTAIASVKDIKGPARSRKTIEVTTHDSVGGYDEFVTGLRSAGDLTFSIIYDPSTPSHGTPANGLNWQFDDAGSAGSWDLIFPLTGSPGFKFLGDLTGFSPNAPLNDALSADITVKVSGKTVYAAAIT
jgi:predicted secreted protein